VVRAADAGDRGEQQRRAPADGVEEDPAHRAARRNTARRAGQDGVICQIIEDDSCSPT
jgi:hypothetical protein